MAGFELETRARNLDRLADATVDVLVVGGGITGAGVAREAALRGLSVALVEARDFASGTSSRSSKLIHGGLRYLEQGEIALVREAATERRHLRRIAPHRARVMPMLVPVYGRTTAGVYKLRVGLSLFDKLAAVAAPERHRILSRGEVLDAEPGILADRLQGAAVYPEYVTDDARLVLDTLKSAHHAGALVANYTRLTGLGPAGKRRTVEVRDEESGATLSLRATVIVNAAGPWVDRVFALDAAARPSSLQLTKGIHLVFRSQDLPVRHCVVMRARDGRPVFAVPRGPDVYVGTTDTVYDGPLEEPAVTAADAAYLFEAVARSFPATALTPRAVIGAWAGVRPLVREDGKSPSEISRKDEITISGSGLVTIAGGKLTTYRRMAERVLAAARPQLGIALPDVDSAEIPLAGGDLGDAADLATFTTRLAAEHPNLPAETVTRLAEAYGGDAREIIAGAGDARRVRAVRGRRRAFPRRGALCRPSRDGADVDRRPGAAVADRALRDRRRRRSRAGRRRRPRGRARLGPRPPRRRARFLPAGRARPPRVARRARAGCMRDAAAIRDDLAGLLGSGRVVDDPSRLARVARDTWVISVWRSLGHGPQPTPACAVRPRSTAEVSAVLAYASRERIAVVPFGAGSGVCGAVLPADGAIVLDLGAMSAFRGIDETALLATAEPGLLGSDFEAELNRAGYSMGHFPQSIALSSVGGWVATRAAGQFSTKYGNIEQRLVAFEAVLPSGAVVRTRAVPRSATGPDLRHLFLGAEGTTGVLTELTFEVHPLPEASRHQSYAFPSMAAGLEAIRSLLRRGWRPAVVRLYDEIEAGRAFAGTTGGGESLLIVISEGPRGLADAELAAIDDTCRAAGARVVGPEPVASWLDHRNKVPGFEMFLNQGMVVDTIEVATSWSRIVELYDGVLAAMRAVPGLVVASGHSSHSYGTGTNIYFTFAAKPDAPEDLEPLYFRIWDAAMTATLAAGGTISHHHGIGRVRREWLVRELGTAYPLLATLKDALDPGGIMNPGALIAVREHRPQGPTPGRGGTSR